MAHLDDMYWQACCYTHVPVWLHALIMQTTDWCDELMPDGVLYLLAVGLFCSNTNLKFETWEIVVYREIGTYSYRVLCNTYPPRQVFAAYLSRGKLRNMGNLIKTCGWYGPSFVLTSATLVNTVTVEYTVCVDPVSCGALNRSRARFAISHLVQSKSM